MPDLATLGLFVVASAALIAIPGPAVLFIIARTVAHGRRAGTVSMLGVEAGVLVHVGAAAVGLSAVVASSAAAFTVVKYAGAAYLILLGIQSLRRGTSETGEPPRPGNRRLFGDGVLVNALNPKVAIFFLAFLPQFVDPAAGSVALQVLVLGACFIAVAMVLDAAWVLVAGGIGRRLPAGRALDRLSAGVYFTLGAAAALTGERPRR